MGGIKHTTISRLRMKVPVVMLVPPTNVTMYLKKEPDQFVRRIQKFISQPLKWFSKTVLQTTMVEEYKTLDLVSNQDNLIPLAVMLR